MSTRTSTDAAPAEAASVAMSCPFCERAGTARSKGVELAGGVVYLCEECGGYFLFPPMRVEYTGSNWSDRRERDWAKDVARSHRHAGAIVKMVEGIIGRPVRSVLEIGCGSAFMGPGFEAVGCSYTGVEVDAKLIDFARAKGLRVIHSMAETIGDSEIGHETFDLVLSSNTFEHVDRPRAAFSHLANLCGGAILLIVPNPHGFFQRLKAYSIVRWAIQKYHGNERVLAYSLDGYWHNIAYSRRTLRWLADDARLQVESIRGVGTNDRVLGFVQPNRDPLYSLLSWVTSRLGFASQLLLVARPAGETRG